MSPVPQLLIVYTDDTGNIRAYTPAYTPEQVKEGIINCVARHGRKSSVKSIAADTFRA